MQTIAIYPMTICRPDGFACMMDNGFVERSAPHCRLMPVVLCTAVLRIFAPDVACTGMPWIHSAAHICNTHIIAHAKYCKTIRHRYETVPLQQSTHTANCCISR